MKRNFAGEEKCSCCERPAYFDYRNVLFCGLHCNKNNPDRKKLPVNPQKILDLDRARQEHARSVKDFREANIAQGLKGKVTVQHLRMFGGHPTIPGFQNVFPNFKGEHPSVSPKSLGPVLGYGGETAPTIEIDHQWRKQFTIDLDFQGNPTAKSRQVILDAYRHPPAEQRHKYSRKDLPKDNINKCMFSIHDWGEGEKRFSYIESRFFYCFHMQMLAPQARDFKLFRELIDSGTNIAICGYDAHMDKGDDLMAAYEYEGKPFGHEMVLWTLLTIENPSDYPWNRYAARHPDLYKGFVEKAEKFYSK